MKIFKTSLSLFFAILLVFSNSGAASLAKTQTSTPGAPVNLQIPTLAFDEDSITLVWEKPENYIDIVDFNVYMDGKKIGSALKDNGGPAKQYIDNFYENIDKDDFHVDILIHNFTVENLEANRSYQFYVTSVNKDGVESAPSNKIEGKTTPLPEVFNIVDFGATPDDDTKDTKAIQAAIDAATKGAKVLIPEGKFISGEIWLKSDMTLQVDGYLLGSDDPKDYSRNFWVYDYSTDERSYSLINAHTYDYGSLKNIRITGKGTIDGNGWKHDPSKNPTIDEAGKELPFYFAGNNSKVTGNVTVEEGKMSPLNLNSPNTLGILGATQSYASQEMGMNVKSAYSTRSSLITVRGVDGMYYEGFTQLNPAFHGIVNLHSKNIVVNGTISKTYDANNADGYEFGDSQHIMVFNNFVDTGDDAINFAAGMGQAAADKEPTGDAWIFNNYIREGHGGVVTGSHTGSWIQDFVVEDNIMYKTDVGLRSKTNTPMGGGARNILFRDNALEGIDGDGPFVFTSSYEDANAAILYEPAQQISQFRDMMIENTTIRNQGGSKKQAILVQGNNDAGEVYHENITFKDVKFDNVYSVNMDYAKNFKFINVAFTNVKDNNGNPWRIKNSTELAFENTTAEPVDATQRPKWSKDSAVQAISSEDGKSVSLTWDAATDNVGVAGYTIYKDGEKIGSGYTTTKETSFTVSGLTPANKYRFKVEATDAIGNRTSDGPTIKVKTNGEADVTAPVPPANTEIKEPTTTIPASETFSGKAVEVVYPGFTWASVSWEAASDDIGIAGYNVYANGKLHGFAKSSNYTLSNLQPGTKYDVTVEAVDLAGNKTPYNTSLEVETAVPYAIGAPFFNGVLRAKVDKENESVTLSWNEAKANNQEVIGYRVYVNGQPIKPEGAEFTPINSEMTTADTTYTINGLEPGKEYTFKVEAVGKGVKYSKRERLSDVIPNGLIRVEGYRWSGFGPSKSLTLK
ncbi:exo-poly-alpha-galacturonosidase [Bacillus niacini]|uniref:Exo-poly-alpha-galacturonosidase n=1 Tax=Neobacillus niacini TaxID=86668 RepID=A0A852TAB6_9BACI|nr:fibronectin type III domain-containing protein [Neobacillus niacini]NYE05693.1 exo-poly-alpha-galacturonosidase [Neobacillus niacini]